MSDESQIPSFESQTPPKYRASECQILCLRKKYCHLSLRYMYSSLRWPKSYSIKISNIAILGKKYFVSLYSEIVYLRFWYPSRLTNSQILHSITLCFFVCMYRHRCNAMYSITYLLGCFSFIKFDIICSFTKAFVSDGIFIVIEFSFYLPQRCLWSHALFHS